MLGTLWMFNEPFANLVTITFSALIMIELLNIHSCLHNLRWKMIANTIITLILYIISIGLLKNYFDTAYITWPFVLKVMLLTAISHLPLYIG